MKYLLLAFACLFIGKTTLAQNCDCLLTEVENNTVNPCTLIIGSVDTVRTTAQLKDAIVRANASGGNTTILIADGTYPIASPSWYPYITASHVVFRSLSGKRDKVILTGTGMKSVSPKVENGFYLVGNNITIADLTIKELGNHGIAGHGDKLFVHNVKIQNTFEQMIKGTSAEDGMDSARVQCSLFEYTAGIGPQYYIGGLDIHKCNNWTVNDNVFRNIASPSASVAEHAIHFWNSSANNTIERNLIVNCDRGIGFGLGSSPNQGGIIRNNMIYNNGSAPFNDVGIGLESSPNTQVYNNTIYIAYPNAIEYRFAATTNVAISNNLSNKIIKSRNGGSASLKTNNTGALSQWFVNTGEGNLRLANAIPEVIDKGTALAGLNEDIDKNERAQSGGIDIGASEYQFPVGVYDNEREEHIRIFPNPASTQITISANLGGTYSLLVYNGCGQLVANHKNVALHKGFSIHVNSWENGVYYARIMSEHTAIKTLKIIVSK
jgi:hypothetical protein